MTTKDRFNQLTQEAKSVAQLSIFALLMLVIPIIVGIYVGITQASAQHMHAVGLAVILSTMILYSIFNIFELGNRLKNIKESFELLELLSKIQDEEIVKKLDNLMENSRKLSESFSFFDFIIIPKNFLLGLVIATLFYLAFIF